MNKSAVFAKVEVQMNAFGLNTQSNTAVSAFVFNTESMQVVATIHGANHETVEAAFGFEFDVDTHGFCYNLTADLTMGDDVQNIDGHDVLPVDVFFD